MNPRNPAPPIPTRLLAVCATLLCAAACLSACDTSNPRPAISTPAPDTEPKGLYGLFGATFGDILPANAQCTTNASGALVCRYTPTAPFRNFTFVLLNATPTSRQVYRIVAMGNDDIDVVSSAFEKRYGIAPEASPTTRTFRFETGDAIRLGQAASSTGTNDVLLIDAICPAVRSLSALEQSSLDWADAQ